MPSRDAIARLSTAEDRRTPGDPKAKVLETARLRRFRVVLRRMRMPKVRASFQAVDGVVTELAL